MTDGSDRDSEAAASLRAAEDQAWVVVRMIIDSAAADQRSFLRRTPRLVRLNKDTVESIIVWTAEFLFPSDQEFTGGWVVDDEVANSSDE